MVGEEKKGIEKGEKRLGNTGLLDGKKLQILWEE